MLMAVNDSGTRRSPSRTSPCRGAITEVIGRLSSGRTSIVIAWAADVTRAGGVVAVVDTDDTFDPDTATRAGVDLARVLWVRCGGRRDAAIRATELLARAPGFALIALDTGHASARLPLARAFRLKLAARRANTALVIVAERRIAGPAADVALETIAGDVAWSRLGARATRLVAMRTTLHLVRPQAAAHPRVSSGRWPRAVDLIA